MKVVSTKRWSVSGWDFIPGASASYLSLVSSLLSYFILSYLPSTFVHIIEADTDDGLNILIHRRCDTEFIVVVPHKILRAAAADATTAAAAVSDVGVPVAVAVSISTV